MATKGRHSVPLILCSTSRLPHCDPTRHPPAETADFQNCSRFARGWDPIFDPTPTRGPFYPNIASALQSTRPPCRCATCDPRGRACRHRPVPRIERRNPLFGRLCRSDRHRSLPRLGSPPPQPSAIESGAVISQPCDPGVTQGGEDPDITIENLGGCTRTRTLDPLIKSSRVCLSTPQSASTSKQLLTLLSIIMSGFSLNKWPRS